jgi:hypothetical protein
MKLWISDAHTPEMPWWLLYHHILLSLLLLWVKPLQGNRVSELVHRWCNLGGSHAIATSWKIFETILTNKV